MWQRKLLLLLTSGKLFSYGFQRRKRNNTRTQEGDEEPNPIDHPLERGWYIDLKEGAGNLVSAQTLQGRILVCCSLINY